MTGPRTVPTSGRLNQEIANAVVRHHKRMLGRGPTKAQAFYRHNIVVVVMEDTLTEAERAVAAQSGREAVLQMRLRYEAVMKDDLVRAVEEATGCKVQAFISGNHIEPDLAAQLFVLDRPIAGEPLDRAAD
jgi:uncharacterized protein YbcI